MDGRSQNNVSLLLRPTSHVGRDQDLESVLKDSRDGVGGGGAWGGDFDGGLLERMDELLKPNHAQ